MGEIKRAADGRRLFTPEFKREQIARVSRNELTMAELMRELDVHPSVVRRWQKLIQQGAAVTVEAGGDVVPASLLREAEKRIRDLEQENLPSLRKRRSVFTVEWVVDPLWQRQSHSTPVRIGVSESGLVVAYGVR